ncbi:GlcG/HbpS family heme-binding protein [Acidovorax sp. NCPPB 4044]|uniref:GlcG/HbpS family heme-binding protein n=1 Tax=Acidovorax sp. NCPPB 4044 TaxID=2940490 RepID=UPI0023033EBF|nr:heme-binding protein [Acidovorax sp. NCPPB 4044]
MRPTESAAPGLAGDQAAGLVARAMEMAAQRGLDIAVAVVDSAGHLLAFQRDARAFPASVELAIAKARTAAMFRRDTQAMQESLEKGRLSYLALPGALPLAGGVPLVLEGTVVGAVGISGAASGEDAELARKTASVSGGVGESE